jgi:hypothetical protein
VVLKVQSGTSRGTQYFQGTHEIKTLFVIILMLFALSLPFPRERTVEFSGSSEIAM